MMDNLPYTRKKLELISLCKSFLHQEYEIKPIKEKIALKPKEIVTPKTTLPKKEVVPEVLSPKKEEIIKKEPVKVEQLKKEPVKEVAEKKEEKKKEPLTYNYPFLRLLPRERLSQKTYKTQDLSQVEEFLVKNSPNLKLCKEPLNDDLAQSKAIEWKKNAPKILFISFLLKNSEEDLFIQSVVDATKKHLGSAALIVNPKIDLIGEIIIAGEEEALKNVIIIYKKETLEDFSELLSSYIQTSSLEQDCNPLSFRGNFIKTSFFEYKLGDLYNSPAEKGSLWKTLRSLVVS